MRAYSGAIADRARCTATKPSTADRPHPGSDAPCADNKTPNAAFTALRTGTLPLLLAVSRLVHAASTSPFFVVVELPLPPPPVLAVAVVRAVFIARAAALAALCVLRIRTPSIFSAA